MLPGLNNRKKKDELKGIWTIILETSLIPYLSKFVKQMTISLMMCFSRDQWFLNHGARERSDMNVLPAWKLGYTGKNVVVTIPVLMQNYDPLASKDINDNEVMEVMEVMDNAVR